MSLFNNTQGGGTGGASASIFVTGLSEADTVTATKDGKTVKGKWGSKTAYEIKPLIPVMTSNTAPSGVASASDGRGDEHGFPYKVFDDDWSGGLATNYGAELPVWIEYDFQEEREISYFEAYFAADDQSYDTVSTGYVSVSNDGGETWEPVVSFTGLASVTKHTITLNTPVKCKKFRFYFTAYNNTYAQGTVRVNEIQAYGYVPFAVYGHEITIKDYGMWTVTATNGEKTTTQDVLVDAAMDYEVYLPYILWLYREGEEFEAVTGGWGVDGWTADDWSIASVATKNADNMYLKTPGTNSYCFAGTKEDIVTNGRKTLYIDFSTSSATSAALEVAVTTNKHFSQDDVFYEAYTNKPRGIVSVDISENNLPIYVCFASGGQLSTRYGNIYNVWLE